MDVEASAMKRKIASWMEAKKRQTKLLNLIYFQVNNDFRVNFAPVKAVCGENPDYLACFNWNKRNLFYWKIMK